MAKEVIDNPIALACTIQSSSNAQKMPSCRRTYSESEMLLHSPLYIDLVEGPMEYSYPNKMDRWYQRLDRLSSQKALTTTSAIRCKAV